MRLASSPRETVDYVISVNSELEELCGGQIVIVLVDYLGDVYADEFTVSLFNDWQISGSGMLLAASTQENRGGITVGSEIEGSFPDSMKSQYLDRYFWMISTTAATMRPLQTLWVRCMTGIRMSMPVTAMVSHFLKGS